MCLQLALDVAEQLPCRLDPLGTYAPFVRFVEFTKEGVVDILMFGRIGIDAWKIRS